MHESIYIIVGASRGLGASLVSKYLEKRLRVFGIGRSGEDTIEKMAVWKETGRFRYIQTDIGEAASVSIMKSIIDMCEGSPLCVIFNAAVIESDVDDDRKIKFDTFKKVNLTGINGFGHTLEAFADHLTKYGSMLVGISSISAWFPPVGGNKIAYPASKAYLDMALRSLRLLWERRVHVMTVHLGHIGGKGSWFVTEYDVVAQKIVEATLSHRPPKSICKPAFYCFVSSIMRMMPDRFISGVAGIVKGLLKRDKLQ